MTRFKKGELALYQKHTPKEIKELKDKVLKDPKNITYFIQNYKYNYVTKKWTKAKK